MKKAVIIGASDEALHTIEKAHEHGIFVTAIDGNPNAGGLKASDKALVVDISDEIKTIEAVREEESDYVLTVPIGRYLTTIGAVNDALGLPGISKEMAAFCTDKLKFHRKLREEGLRSCKCYLLNERGVLEGLLSGKLPIRYPAIAKPRFGSGSRGIQMLFSKEEMKAYFEQLLDEEDILIEECISGEEYGVDGAVIQGRFQFILLRKKINTPFPARQAVAYFSVQPQDTFYVQVKEYMEKITACLGLNECLLHADIIRSENGPFVIELSARPSGHNLHNLFTPLCTGIDPAEEYIKYRSGENYSFEPKQTKTMMIHYFDLRGKAAKIPSEEEVEAVLPEHMKLIRWNCNIKPGDDLEEVTNGHSLMGRGYYILQDISENDEDKTLRTSEKQSEKQSENQPASEKKLTDASEKIRQLFVVFA